MKEYLVQGDLPIVEFRKRRDQLRENDKCNFPVNGHMLAEGTPGRGSIDRDVPAGVSVRQVEDVTEDL